MATEPIRRGRIYLVDLAADPAAQPKKRPMLVVQNDQGNKAGATTIVVSLTSATPSQVFPFHVHLPAGVLGKPGVILCEQVKTVSLDRVVKEAALLVSVPRKHSLRIECRTAG